MKIITITLNPAFDIHCCIDRFVPYHENFANVTERDAGGKGINISRALTANGIENIALVVVGEENKREFCQKLLYENLKLETIVVPGRIRENITIHSGGVNETRISFHGFEGDSNLLSKVNSIVEDLLEKETIVTFTGRVPSGVCVGEVKNFLRGLKENGIRVVVDSRSFELDDILDVRPWMIKPNAEEISHYLGKKIASQEQAVVEAQRLRESGIDNVMISLGAEGAVLACEAGCFCANSPEIKVESTIGAGDSSIAGFLVGVIADRLPPDWLRLAVAYGSAACMKKGTQAPNIDDVNRLVERIIVRSV